MSKKYRVIFHGLTTGDLDAFKARMAFMGAPVDIVERMIKKAPVILKGNLTLGDARRYSDAVQEAGGRVTIQEHGYFEESGHMNHPVSIAPFEDFTMCPECGLKQARGEVCVKCGFVFGKGRREQVRENA